MIKIIAVCGMGLGSGLLARMSVERVLQKHDIKDNQFSVEVADVGSAKRQDVDIYVTTSEFAHNLEGLSVPIVLVKNLFDEEEMDEALMPVYWEVAESKGE